MDFSSHFNFYEEFVYKWSHMAPCKNFNYSWSFLYYSIKINYLGTLGNEVIRIRRNI